MSEDFMQGYDAHFNPASRLVRVDLAGIADCQIDPTRYAVEPILPRGHVTLLGSHGGAGKSMLSLTLAAHVVCGRSWCGLHVLQGKAVYVSLEDPGELVRYRLKRIADEYGLDPVSLSEGLLVLDGSKTDSVLAMESMENGVRKLSPTSTLEELSAAAEGRSLIIIDNASDAYDANENDRRLVRAFVRRLAHVAREHDAAVQLLAHIDKSAARAGANGNTYSGSTAWHNSARSRLALTEQDGRIELAHEKNNLGKKAEPIALTWSDAGVLVPISASITANQGTEDDAAVLAAIAAAIGDGATVHGARSGSHSTLAVLKTYPELPKELRNNPARFWAALTRLERASRVSRETYKNEYRKERVRLSVARVTPPHPLSTDARAGARQCASGLGAALTRNRRTDATCPKCDGEGCKHCREAA